MEFKGPSKHYILQQVTLTLKTLASLSKLDHDSELQGLNAVLAAATKRREDVLAAKKKAESDEPK